MSHSAGPMASATSVSNGDRNAMIVTDSTNSSALPSSIGSMPSSPWTMFRSEIARLTTWPVRSWSCRAPSSAASAANDSVRMSCWTSSDSLPPSNRRVYTPAKFTRPAPISTSAPAQTGASWVRIVSSTIKPRISGIAAVASVATSAPASESSMLRLCRQQYLASRRSQASGLLSCVSFGRLAAPLVCFTQLALRMAGNS